MECLPFQCIGSYFRKLQKFSQPFMSKSAVRGYYPRVHLTEMSDIREITLNFIVLYENRLNSIYILLNQQILADLTDRFALRVP